MKEERPIRILQYIGSLNIGGSQTMIMNYYRNIDRTKIQFDFVVDRKNDVFFVKEIESMGGKVYFLDYFKGYNIISFKKQWNRLFKEHPEYKIIHCHVRSVASIVLKIAKKYGLKTLCHSHSTSNGKGIKSLTKWFLQKKIPKYADNLLACSEESAIWLYGKDNVLRDNCAIINNAIDTKKFLYNDNIRCKVRKNLKVENKKVIIQVGRFVEVKNYIFTLEMFKELLKENEEYYLLLVGNGPLKDAIIDKIKSLQLEKNVNILENRNDVNELLIASDIYVMPSLYEGLPLSLVEAQAASLPCIISKNISGGKIIKELIYDLDLDNNFEEWIQKIKELSNFKRKIRLNEIINTGFDIEKNVDTLVELYLKLI